MSSNARRPPKELPEDLLGTHNISCSLAHVLTLQEEEIHAVQFELTKTEKGESSFDPPKDTIVQQSPQASPTCLGVTAGVSRICSTDPVFAQGNPSWHDGQLTGRCVH